jgi:hypothetical protein
MQTAERDRAGRRRMTGGRRLRRVVGVALVAAFLVWWWVVPGAQRRDIGMARGILRLAPLPADATDVHTASVHALTWESASVRFTAPPSEIEAFLASSPGLKGVAPKQFTPAHRYLPDTRIPKDLDPDVPRRDTYFRDDARIHHLPWFDRTITQAGRGYFVSFGPNPDDDNGEVVVDDARNVVYIDADNG